MLITRNSNNYDKVNINYNDVSTNYNVKNYTDSGTSGVSMANSTNIMYKASPKVLIFITHFWCH